MTSVTEQVVYIRNREAVRKLASKFITKSWAFKFQTWRPGGGAPTCFEVGFSSAIDLDRDLRPMLNGTPFQLEPYGH